MFPRPVVCLFVAVAIYFGTFFFSVDAARDDSSLKIAAFNIKWFGRQRRSDSAFGILTRIVAQYDLILIQEILKEDALWRLLGDIQSIKSDFECELSAPQGTVPTYKEYYAYCYSSSKFKIVHKHQWSGDFAYPPYAVWLKPTNRAFPEFGFIGAHLTITDAKKGRETYKEMDKLVDVYNYLKGQWGLENFIFAGDFNAGCAYMTSEKWSKVRLKTDRKFSWFISDNEKTNLGRHQDCPYDRIVGVGNELVSRITQYGVYRFDQNLTDAKAKEISDHFPVYAEILATKTRRSLWTSFFA